MILPDHLPDHLRARRHVAGDAVVRHHPGGCARRRAVRRDRPHRLHGAGRSRTATTASSRRSRTARSSSNNASTITTDVPQLGLPAVCRPGRPRTTPATQCDAVEVRGALHYEPITPIFSGSGQGQHHDGGARTARERAVRHLRVASGNGEHSNEAGGTRTAGLFVSPCRWPVAACLANLDRLDTR